MPNRLTIWFQRHKYREGKTLSRFIAKDVRREVLVVSADRIADGLITARVRTTNLLYVSKGLTQQSDFGPEEEILLSDLWHWSGKDWGGLPDGTSIGEHLQTDPDESSSEEETQQS